MTLSSSFVAPFRRKLFLNQRFLLPLFMFLHIDYDLYNNDIYNKDVRRKILGFCGYIY